MQTDRLIVCSSPHFLHEFQPSSTTQVWHCHTSIDWFLSAYISSTQWDVVRPGPSERLLSHLLRNSICDKISRPHTLAHQRSHNAKHLIAIDGLFTFTFVFFSAKRRRPNVNAVSLLLIIVARSRVVFSKDKMRVALARLTHTHKIHEIIYYWTWTPTLAVRRFQSLEGKWQIFQIFIF